MFLKWEMLTHSNPFRFGGCLAVNCTKQQRMVVVIVLFHFINFFSSLEPELSSSFSTDVMLTSCCIRYPPNVICKGSNMYLCLKKLLRRRFGEGLQTSMEVVDTFYFPLILCTPFLGCYYTDKDLVE